MPSAPRVWDVNKNERIDSMKTQKKISGIALLLTVAVSAQAVEGLRVSLQNNNAILSWTSTDSDFYLVQYSTNLNSNPPWQTLTNWMPGAEGTNTTYFVHEGAAPDRGATSSSFSAGNELLSFRSLTCDTSSRPVQWVMPRDNPSSIVPMFIYPPGYNFNGFLLFDPLTESWSSGDGIIRSSDNVGPPIPSGSFETNTNAFFSSDIRLYRVVRHGVSLVGITNGMTLSGTVTIPLEVGLDDGVLTTVCVEEDGTPIGNSIKTAPFSSPLQVTIDTTSMSNGVHEISAFASWRPSSGLGDGGDTKSEPVTVNVFNPISFPDWMDYFGELYNQLSLKVQLGYTNIDWEIDVYGNGTNYIGTFGGHSSDGIIDGYWDLVGPNSVVHTNEIFFDFAVRIPSFPGQQSLLLSQSTNHIESPKRRSYRHPDNWISNGMWVVADQNAWEYSIGGDLLVIAANGFVTFGETLGLTVRPSERESGESYHIPYENEDTAAQTTAWNNLRNALFNPESRNFFYLGHGSPNGIGSGTNTNRFISASEIANRLHTSLPGDQERHAYRFVFLYGCSTATGKLPQSFGIPNREDIKMNEFADAALTPCAFVGWNNRQMAEIASHVQMYHVHFLQAFSLEWANGYGVKEALTRAKTHSGTGGISLDKLKVFGYWGLGVNTFNMYYGN